MKSCWIVSKGHQSVLEWRDIPVPQPRPDEIIIRVRATALNYGEFVVGGAIHGGSDKVGGNEAAGEVVAVGEKVTGFRAGDRVFGRVRGGFAEYAPMFVHQAMLVPPRLSWEEAAAIPVSFITAYEMLYPPYGNLRAEEWLLVVGASSGTGVASVQIAKAIGAHTIGTSGSAEKLARLKTAGLDVAIATRSADFGPQVREATGGRGADLIVNFVGGTMFAECLGCLARHGRLGIVGYLDGVMEARIDLAIVHANRHQIFGISNAKLVSEERAQAARGFARDVLPAVADGRITPLIGRVFAFDELPAAKACMDSSGTVGKIVVRVA